jgi:Zn-dependent M16 (insulinase) family peptidase
VAGRWLKDSQTTALVTTYPEPGAKEQADAALAEKLEAVKAAMSADEIAELVAATNAGAPEDHSAEYVSRLKAVTVASLPEEIKSYTVTDATDDDGNIRHIEAPAAVEGISQNYLLLDIAGLPQEDIHWFTLYTNLITQLDTTAHTKAELARRAGMSDVYLHQVFSGKRKPSRDRVLCFCVGLDATVEETQKLLEQASLARLYPRNRRDAIVLHGLAHGTALDEINDALFVAGEETLC